MWENGREGRVGGSRDGAGRGQQGPWQLMGQCMHVCVRMCVRVCMCTCVCVHACTRVPGCVCTYVHMCAGVCMHVCMCVCTHVHECMYVCECTCVYVGGGGCTLSLRPGTMHTDAQPASPQMQTPRHWSVRNPPGPEQLLLNQGQGQPRGRVGFGGFAVWADGGWGQRGALH